MEKGAGLLAVMKGGIWVVVVVSVVVLLVGGASAGNVVINDSDVPISIQQSDVNAANNNESSVVVAQNAIIELPDSFADSSVVVRNEATGGVSAPFKMESDDAMLIQSSPGSVTNMVTVLLGTLVEGALTGIRTLFDGL